MKHIIWSNRNLDLDDWIDFLEDEYPEITDEHEQYHLIEDMNMEYLEDECCNLSKKVQILVYGTEEDKVTRFLAIRLQISFMTEMRNMLSGIVTDITSRQPHLIMTEQITMNTELFVKIGTLTTFSMQSITEKKLLVKN